MKKALLIAGLVFLALLIVILARTLTFSAPPVAGAVNQLKVEADPGILSRAIQFQTIAHKAEMIDSSAFLGFHRYLDSVFPRVHQEIFREKVNDYSLLYTWQGTSLTLKPLVVMAHQDVVPVEYSTLSQWDHPPFSGKIANGYIYGRGTIDDKGSLIALLSAAEALLQAGYQPQRTIYICFGHDEEISGKDGAQQIAALLESRGVEAYMVLDEGGTLSRGLVPGIEEDVALIGTAEKGYVSIELAAEVPGGHSSMPEERTALGLVNQGIQTLQQNPFPSRLTSPLEGFVETIGPELPFVQKMAFANTWLFKPMIFKVYQQSAAGAALVQTTQVPTLFKSGVKDNIVPNRAYAIVNFRLLPGDTPEEVLMRCRKLVNDSSVRITIYDNVAIPASPISPHQAVPFQKLTAVVRSVYPKALVSPYLVLGATDARYFYNLTDYVYRFSPIPIAKNDLPRIHGTNERISLEGFEQSVNFYATLLKTFGNS